MPSKFDRCKLALRFACYLWLAWILVVWLAMNYFGFTRPRNPVPAEGRFYPFNDHGTIVYLTKIEHPIIDLWFWYIVVMAILATIAQKFGAWNKNTGSD